METYLILVSNFNHLIEIKQSKTNVIHSKILPQNYNNKAKIANINSFINLINHVCLFIHLFFKNI